MSEKQVNAPHDATAHEEGRHPRRATISRVRNAVILVAFLAIGVGIAFHTGWGTLSSLGVGAIAAICPLGVLETLVASKTAIPRALVVLAVVLVLGVVLGRMFCGWVCPVPPISRFFHPRKRMRGRKRANAGETPEDAAPRAEACAAQQGCTQADCAGCKGLPPVGGERDGRHLDTRHWVLGGSLLSAAVFGFPVFCLICPVGLVFATLIVVWRALGYQDPTWSLLVFPLILVLELAVFRKWCHRLCPLGALLSLLSWGNRCAQARVDEQTCLRSSQGADCRVCVDVCPERLDPHSAHIPECTKCGICLEQCPAAAIRIGPVGKRGRAEAS